MFFDLRDTLIHIIKMVYFSFVQNHPIVSDHLHWQWVSGQFPSLQLSWHHFCIPEILSYGTKATQSSSSSTTSSSSMTFSVVLSSVFSVVCSVGTTVDGSIGSSSSFPSLWNISFRHVFVSFRFRNYPVIRISEQALKFSWGPQPVQPLPSSPTPQLFPVT